MKSFFKVGIELHNLIMKYYLFKIAVVRNPPANVGDIRVVGLVPGLGRSPGVGNGNPLQYCCLENSMDRGAWWATVHGVQFDMTKHEHGNGKTAMYIKKFQVYIQVIHSCLYI